jgi:4'-phosphopantetheinyl transferase
MLSFTPKVIQIWAAWLTCSDHMLAQYKSVLSDEERARSEKFAFERDRRASIASRGILRNILSKYVRIPANALNFQYNRFGKPYLVTSHGEPGLQFNVTHSGSLALYAIWQGDEVGIDVEQVRMLDDLDGMAASTFSAVESTALHSLPVEQRLEAFYVCWTRKEAFIKALGTGLAYALSDFDVTLKPGEPARILRIDKGSPDEWTLADLRPAAGYVGALAVPMADASIQFDWWDAVDSV